MDFEVIPAVDVRNGRTARMSGGDPDALQDLGQDPVRVAADLVASGARWIHLVDLDAAIGGGLPANLDVVARVAELPVRVQAGGSLTPEGVERSLDGGADRAVLGAAILSDPPALRAALRRFGHRVGVAVDVRDGAVVPRGSRTVGPDLSAALDVVAAARPAFVTCTVVARDGALSGPDFWTLRRVAEHAGVPVVASGGVRSLDDIQALLQVDPPLAGVIVGRALHGGRLSLTHAVAAARTARG